MSLRTCAYRHCDSCAIDNVSSGNFTMFQFPKEPERRLKWLQLGGIGPNMIESTLYMCSLHFDEKYLSQSARRTILIGPAVPFDYRETEYIVTTEKTESRLEDRVESTTQDMDGKDGDDLSQNIEFYLVSDEDLEADLIDETPEKSDEMPQSKESQPDKDECEKRTTALAGSKRKIKEEIAQALISMKHPENENLIPEMVVKSKKARPRNTEPQTCFNKDLIDEKKVTTFIFRGEEYVQMPKEMYIREKSLMLNKIKIYENAMKTIRQSADDALLQC